MEFSVDFFGQMELHFFLTKRTERIEPYHLIRSFGCQCFPAPLRSKARIMKAKVKHKYRRPKLNLNLSHLECYNCVARSLLTVAAKIKQLSRHEQCGTVKIHQLESVVLGIAVFSEIAWHWYKLWTNGTEISGNSGKSEKKEYLGRYYPFPENIPPE